MTTLDQDAGPLRSAKKGSEIEECFSHLETCIAECHKAHSSLKERVAPFSRLVEKVLPVAGEIRPPMLVPIAERMHKSIDELELLRDAINETTRRIDL